MDATSTIAPDQVMKVSNTTGADIQLWIEPLGDCLPMPKGETFEIVATGELGHQVEIEVTEDAIRVHGWIKCVSSVASTGQRKRLWELPSA